MALELPTGTRPDNRVVAVVEEAADVQAGRGEAPNNHVVTAYLVFATRISHRIIAQKPDAGFGGSQVS